MKVRIKSVPQQLNKNSRKWKHELGGHLFEDGGDIEEKRPPMVPFKQREEVIITPNQEYNKYLNTLPDNQRFTPNEEYDSYLYWQLNGKPKDFKEAYDRDMFNYDHSDNSYHGNSIAYDDNGIGYFIKPKTHDTVKYELDWYNKSLVTEEGGHQRHMDKEEQAFHDDFKSKYDLIDDPDRPNYYRYQPKVKAFGGHLFAGGGIKKYVGALEDIGYDPNSMKFYEKATGKELGDSAILDELVVAGRDRIKDFLTESNDATQVRDFYAFKDYNPHLRQRAEQGAISNALWEQEHPNMTSWRNMAESVPFAVAAAPAVMAGGEALASTALGQGVTSGLNFLAGAAKASPIVSTVWPYADVGLTSVFGAHGASEIAEGNVTPETLLEAAPLLQLTKPIGRAVTTLGKSFNKPFTITPKNYTKVTDAQWNEAYSKALDAGDMTEAERLEALHLKLKAPNNKVVDEAGNPLLVYRANRWGNHVPYTVFDKTKGGNYRGFYFGNKDAVVERYGEDNLRSFYLNSEKPFIEPNFNILQSGRESLPNNDGMIYAPEGIRNSDFEVKVFEPEQIKLAGPTYDDAGNIIPLSQRHDFSNPDIRYQLGEVPTTLSTLEETQKAAEEGRSVLLDFVKSEANRKRWEEAMPNEDIDLFIHDNARKVKTVPFDYTKSFEELGSFGSAKPRPRREYDIGDFHVYDTDTGIDVSIANDIGEKAYTTGIHEPIHFMTSNSNGNQGFQSADLMGKSYKVYNTPEGKEALILRGKGYEHAMVDYNDNLLPPINTESGASIVVNYPEYVKKEFIRQGMGEAEAGQATSNLIRQCKDLLDKQENQTYLKEWFLDKIKPNIKDPNNVAEIEEYINNHPEIIEENDYINLLVNQTRPGTPKEYSKALSKMLYSTIASGIVAMSNNKSSKDE